jgi:transposase-like protein
VILWAVRWYLRYGLSYRDLEELLAERGIEVDHATLYRWVQRFTPLLIDAARPVRPGRAVVRRRDLREDFRGLVLRLPGRRPAGQVIDVYVSQRRDIASARTFFTAAVAVHGDPGEVISDGAPGMANVIEDWFLPRFTRPASTRTSGSNATTAGSRPGSDRCGG